MCEVKRNHQVPGCVGFTLVELLVVMSFVAIFIVLLLPTLSSATEGSPKTVCESNLEQIGAAVFAYAADNKTNLPPPTYSDFYPRVWRKVEHAMDDRDVKEGNSYVGSSIEEALFPTYIKDWKITLCPTAMSINKLSAAELASNDGTARPYTTYHAYWRAQGFWSHSPRYTTESPRFLLVGDESRQPITKLPNEKSNHPQSKNIAMPAGANWCYLDGSVKWKTTEELTYFDVGTGIMTPNSDPAAN